VLLLEPPHADASSTRLASATVIRTFIAILLARPLLGRPRGKRTPRTHVRAGPPYGGPMLARSDVAAWGRRTRQVMGFAAVTGALTGLGVAGFEWVTRFRIFNSV